MMGSGGWLGGWLMLLFGALVVAGIAVLVIWAIRSAAGHGGGHHAVPPVMPGAGTPPPTTPSPAAGAAHDEAVAIARRRLASGEMEPDEFAEVMKHLNG